MLFFMLEGGGETIMEKDAAAIYTTEKATLYHADFLDVAYRIEDNSMDLFSQIRLLNWLAGE